MNISDITALLKEPDRPTYRTETGKFRKETEEEFKKRLGPYHLAQRAKQAEMIKIIAGSNPYSDLMK